MEKITHTNDIITEINRDEWLYQESGRTEVFQAWLDSLETKRKRPFRNRDHEQLTYRNYASPLQ